MIGLHTFTARRGCAYPLFSCKPVPLDFRRGRRSRSCVLLRSAPSWNPQNVPNPQVLPSPSFSAEEAVKVQLEALRDNNNPWPNHGVQTMYEFGADIGGLDPCWYFGFRKDLYHLDHFMGQFGNQLGELINCSGFTIEEVIEGQQCSNSSGPEVGTTPREGTGSADAVVHARIMVGEGGGRGEVRVEFRLRRQTFGCRKGAYVTTMVRKLPSS